MHAGEFDYTLPPELIAQEPAPMREAARLLYLPRRTGEWSHCTIADLPRFLASGDLLVVNDTRVFPARLLGRRVPNGGAVECLLIGRRDPSDEVSRPSPQIWEALVHPGQKLKPGARFEASGARTLQGEVLERRYHGRRLVRLWTDDGSPIEDVIDEVGHVPLPPYIRRPDTPDDRQRYQTVFARSRGSVAAPTAGLHFTPALVDALAGRGVALVRITLHVGYGTFQPVRTETIEAHVMSTESYEIGEDAAAAIARAAREGRRVIAVGTTTTRALETVAREHGGVVAARGETDLFIHPGFQFRTISGLLTNFHLPRSSLLVLVAAFAGRERTLAAYQDAIARRYRFYSYGDAMLIL